eukprot:7145495-Ditylum_brightwellii.AAC.1
MNPHLYATFPPTLYYPPYPHQPNVLAQQYWNIHHGQGGNQSLRQIVQMTEHIEQGMHNAGASTTTK